jgi:hypothetical protein
MTPIYLHPTKACDMAWNLIAENNKKVEL